jgi:hypothetical protein
VTVILILRCSRFVKLLEHRKRMWSVLIRNDYVIHVVLTTWDTNSEVVVSPD